MSRRVCLGAALLMVMVPPSWRAVERGAERPDARIRRPVAAAFLADGRLLFVANSRSGTVSIIDPKEGVVRGEVPVGERLADLAAIPGGTFLLAVDDKKHELIVLSGHGNGLTVRTRLPAGPYPVSISVLSNGSRVAVASLWSRRVDVFDISSLPAAPRILYTIRLPFAPRLQCPLPGGSLLAVADSFAGHLAVVDTANGNLVAVHQLRGHNIRGLAVSADGKDLLIAHSRLDSKLATTKENVRTGALLSGVFQRIPIERLQASKPGELEGTITAFGGVGLGAADPAGLAVTGDRIVVSLAGTGEVSALDTDGRLQRRLDIGRRPHESP